MTLDEAIEHALDTAKCKDGECAADHRQLARWLQELKWLRHELATRPAMRMPDDLLRAVNKIAQMLTRERVKNKGALIYRVFAKAGYECRWLTCDELTSRYWDVVVMTKSGLWTIEFWPAPARSGIGRAKCTPYLRGWIAGAIKEDEE